MCLRGAVGTMSALQVWLVFVAALRLLSVGIGIFAPFQFRTQLFPLRPKEGEPAILQPAIDADSDGAVWAYVCSVDYCDMYPVPYDSVLHR